MAGRDNMRSISGLAMLCVLALWIAFGATLVARSSSAALPIPPAAGGLPLRIFDKGMRSVGGSAPRAPVNRLVAREPGREGRAIKGSSVPLRRSVRPVNVYAATLSGKLSERVVRLPERVYVPNSGDGTVDVIDPRTFRVVDRYFVGLIPHHIAPSWDLTKLYVDDEGSSSLTVIDPRSGLPQYNVPVPFPYNLYFTPDGRKAVVVVERLSRLDFRDPHSWRLIKSVSIPWPGVDHLDFTADGRFLLASTEWSGMVVKVDTVTMKIVGQLRVGGLPIDVRLAPDGSVFYIANQGLGGVSIVDPSIMKDVGFIRTGAGAHGLTVSRDTKTLYVTNRLAGTISLISLATRRLVATWHVGGSPDMLQLSPDGRQIWVTERYDGSVDVIDSRTGRVLHTISVGSEPHGLTFFPNAGRYSLGHNGVYR